MVVGPGSVGVYAGDVGDVSVSAGSSVVSLPSDFKELTLDRYPIRVRAQGSTSSSPVVVTTRDTIKSYPLSSKLTYLPLSIRNDRTGNWSIFLDDPASEAMVFEVSYFRYLPKLEADGDYNDLTVSYEDMVETKVKATAFARINEFQDLAGPLEAAYLSTLLPEAIRIDERKSRSGRVYRMGG